MSPIASPPAGRFNALSAPPTPAELSRVDNAALIAETVLTACVAAPKTAAPAATLLTKLLPVVKAIFVFPFGNIFI
jgi:hypothetical protein